jgi:hypothetical protein
MHRRPSASFYKIVDAMLGIRTAAGKHRLLLLLWSLFVVSYGKEEAPREHTPPVVGAILRLLPCS